MAASPGDERAAIPSVEALLGDPALGAIITRFGRPAATEALREVLEELRHAGTSVPAASGIAATVDARLAARHAASPTPVFNLTGTVLHTNLGRALLPEAAIEALVTVARQPANIEFDLARGRRGDRDEHLEAWLARLTGAEAATVVNNNAAALLLALNSLALRRQVPVSRGELVEIGGSFRLPEIMARAGCRLVEVGTTNRTHLRDYTAAIGPRTALLMRVHRSNFALAGFTKSVPDDALAALARAHGLPLLNDLGSGTLLDLRRYGLPHEPTAAEAVAAGADLVTFSGDKLLGGPQCGIVVGRAELVQRLKRNPMKRALRVDKLTIAALGAVLRLYDDPERLAERLPTLRLLTRTRDELRALAARLAPVLQAHLDAVAEVTVVDCTSEIGSGALPTTELPSTGLAIVAHAAGRRGDRLLRGLVERLRALPVPVIGRLHGGRLLLDLRCLEDEAGFVAQLGELVP